MSTFNRADYLRYLSSPAWARKREDCFTYWGWKCCVCNFDYRARHGWLECHHLPEAYRKLGHEDPRRDLRPLCDQHHSKGRLTLYGIRLARSSYIWRKRAKRIWGWLTRKQRHDLTKASRVPGSARKHA